MRFDITNTMNRDGQKKTAQKNPKKTSQKNPPKAFFWGFFENCPKFIQKKAKKSIKPQKTP